MIVNLIQRRDLEGFLFFKIYMSFFLYQTILWFKFKLSNNLMLYNEITSVWSNINHSPFYEACLRMLTKETNIKPTIFFKWFLRVFHCSPQWHTWKVSVSESTN